MILGISMGQETCRILGQVSLNLLFWMKNLQKVYFGPGRDKRENSLHPGQISMARTLEVNGKARQAQGEAKVG